MVSAISRGAAALQFFRVGFLGPVHVVDAEAFIDLSPSRPPCFSGCLCIGVPVKWAFRAFVRDRLSYAPHDSVLFVRRAGIGPMGKSYPQIPPKTRLYWRAIVSPSRNVKAVRSVVDRIIAEDDEGDRRRAGRPEDRYEMKLPGKPQPRVRILVSDPGH